MSSDIVVVGSLNMDMVVSVDRRPDKGETVLGSEARATVIQSGKH
jgi:ribokinase